jgi:hypothetical protein
MQIESMHDCGQVASKAFGANFRSAEQGSFRRKW